MPQLPGVLLVVLGRAHRAVQQGLQRVRQGADRSAGRRQNHIAGEGVVEGRTQAESRPARESCRRLATRWSEVAGGRRRNATSGLAGVALQAGVICAGLTMRILGGRLADEHSRRQL